ncbi:MAG: TnpV protein [Clostridium sp.]|nr:TnpV protein [Clostridium sp.]
MEKELAEVIEENGIMYRLAEDGCYYPDLRLPEGTHYHIGKYGLMRWEYLTANNRREYFRLLMSGKLNEYLHEMDVECHDMVERIAEQMKAGAGITEELKVADPLEWIGLMNNVKNAAEEIVLREMIYA